MMSDDYLYNDPNFRRVGGGEDCYMCKKPLYFGDYLINAERDSEFFRLKACMACIFKDKPTLTKMVFESEKKEEIMNVIEIEFTKTEHDIMNLVSLMQKPEHGSYAVLEKAEKELRRLFDKAGEEWKTKD
jgi:Zn-finger protein